MDMLIFVGLGTGIGIIRCIWAKQTKKTSKIKYYNYRKYAIRYRRLNKSLNEESKNTF